MPDLQVRQSGANAAGAAKALVLGAKASPSDGTAGKAALDLAVGDASHGYCVDEGIGRELFR